MSFRNPILAGPVLVRAAIQSANFAAGSAGWQIQSGGAAEFNGATFRGSVEISGANDLLMYDGVPGFGDLFVALSPEAGFDPYGNSWAQGLTVGNTGGQRIVLGLTGGSPLVYFVSGRSQIHNAAAIQVFSDGSGATGWETIQILGPQDSTQMDGVGMTWSSSSSDGSQIPILGDFYMDPSGGFHSMRTVSYQGAYMTGRVVAVQPGTGTARNNVAVAETWHVIGQSGQPAFGTGFGPNAAVDQSPRFRMEGTGTAGVVRLDGVIYTTAATAAGATAFTLPVGYRPTNRKRFGGLTSNFSGNALGTGDVVISTAGVVTMGPAASASNQQMVLDNITFPVD